jgi:hypothetical protein
MPAGCLLVSLLALCACIASRLSPLPLLQDRAGWVPVAYLQPYLGGGGGGGGDDDDDGHELEVR